MALQMEEISYAFREAGQYRRADLCMEISECILDVRFPDGEYGSIDEYVEGMRPMVARLDELVELIGYN